MFVRFKSIGLISGLLVMIWSGFASETKAQNTLGEILRRMDAHNGALKTMSARVTMVKHNSQLKTWDTMVGSTSYISKSVNGKMYVRVDWTKPVEEHISVIGDQYKLYQPRLKQVIIGKTQKAKNSATIGGALGFMSMSKDQLKANYDVSYLGEERLSSGAETWHLQLIPKTQTSYKAAELWVDTNGMPIQARVIEHNADYTEVLLSLIQKNPSLKGSMFDLKIPDSVKKVPN